MNAIFYYSWYKCSWAFVVYLLMVSFLESLSLQILTKKTVAADLSKAGIL